MAAPILDDVLACPVRRGKANTRVIRVAGPDATRVALVVSVGVPAGPRAIHVAVVAAVVTSGPVPSVAIAIVVTATGRAAAVMSIAAH